MAGLVKNMGNKKGGGKTKDMTTVPVKPSAKKGANVQKNAPGKTKGLSSK